MKIPILAPCPNCKKENYINIELSDTALKQQCACGKDYSGYLSNDITIGLKILSKVSYEFRVNQDFSMSIVLSATAFECELTRLYFKWKQMSDNSSSNQVLEEELRRHRTIKEKIDVTGKLMHPNGLKGFVESDSNLRTIINEGFSSLNMSSLSKDFQEKLFWPRNRILHLGYADYISDDAIICYNFANLGISILREMDKYKQNN